MRKSRKKPWQKNLDLLTPKQLSKYDDSLEVLRMMRAGTSFSKATKTVGISHPTVKKFLGRTLSKRNKRIVAKKNDSLIRKLKMYEKGNQISIHIRGNKNASIIAQYHGRVGQFTDKNDRIALKQFQDKTIKDIFRQNHEFETDPDTILEILSRREEREFFTIYESG